MLSEEILYTVDKAVYSLLSSKNLFKSVLVEGICPKVETELTGKEEAGHRTGCYLISTQGCCQQNPVS